MYCNKRFLGFHVVSASMGSQGGHGVPRLLISRRAHLGGGGGLQVETRKPKFTTAFGAQMQTACGSWPTVGSDPTHHTAPPPQMHVRYANHVFLYRFCHFGPHWADCGLPHSTPSLPLYFLLNCLGETHHRRSETTKPINLGLSTTGACSLQLV